MRERPKGPGHPTAARERSGRRHRGSQIGAGAQREAKGIDRLECAGVTRQQRGQAEGHQRGSPSSTARRDQSFRVATEGSRRRASAVQSTRGLAEVVAMLQRGLGSRGQWSMTHLCEPGPCRTGCLPSLRPDRREDVQVEQRLRLRRSRLALSRLLSPASPA